MAAYLYPTHPCGNWVEDIRNRWKESYRPYFALWFLRVTPKQLVSRENNGLPFWLYMYYSETKIKEYCPDRENLSQAMQVKYRIRVIEHSQNSDANPFAENNVYLIEPPETEAPTIWFKCDRFEEIMKINNGECQALTFHDFEHAEKADLSSALQATIPPVLCKSSIVVLQTNWYEMQS